MRPLPELTPASEWFWTSGADGVLRIQGCTGCRTLVHPPQPVCPACRSSSWAPTPVSGDATVVAFTVNAHPWLPGFDLDPPYVIAVRVAGSWIAAAAVMLLALQTRRLGIVA